MSATPASSKPPSPTQAESRNAIGVEFQDLGKRYGSLWALRRVSIRIAPGEFVLLRGANGSGKSTLLKVAATLTRPSAGAVSYPGAERTGAQEIRSRIGLVAHGTLLYDDLTAAENLRFFGALFGLGDLAPRTATALASVGLSERANSLVRTFSRGMRQRLSLARAMLHGPGLLLLDEPATGLDKEAREWLDRTLESLHAAGCTVVMSTHADEASNAATRTVWLSGGAVVRDSAAAQSGEGAAR